MSTGDEDPDAADVRHVLAGDVEAFEGIVRRWQRRLVNLAWRFCRDRALAEDMAQEAFVKAFRSLSSFRGDASLSTWLTAIAINSYRSRLRRRAPAAADLDLAREATEGSTPAEELEERERAAAVRRAVLALPPRYRDAIVLFYLEERDLKETAGILDVREGTLKAWLHRGRELLERRCAVLGADRTRAEARRG